MIPSQKILWFHVKGFMRRPLDREASPKTDSFRWHSERATMAADCKTGTIDSS